MSERYLVTGPGMKKVNLAMQSDDVTANGLPNNLVLTTGFMNQLTDEYNIRHDRPKDARVPRSDMIAWLIQRADENSDVDGLSILESQIVLRRGDVRRAVSEDGSVNIDLLRSWAMTHGAHELGLDGQFLSDTIEHALSIIPVGAIPNPEAI